MSLPPNPRPPAASRRDASLQRDDVARFFDLSLDLLAVASLETGSFVRAGAGFSRVLGWTEADLDERPFMSLVHPDDLGSAQEALAALASGADLVAFESRAVCKDGTHRWIEWQIAPGGEGGLIYAAGRDVTERRRREAVLAVLADLAGDLARVSTERDVLDAVGARIGGHLGDVTVFLADIDEGTQTAAVGAAWGDRSEAVAGDHPISAFLNPAFVEGARKGKTAVVRDVETDPRTAGSEGKSYSEVGVGAFIAVPGLRDGAWLHLFIVTAGEPRDWRADEVALVEEAAARAVPRLERARAEARVRDSETHFRALFESIDVGFALIDMVYENGAAVDYRFIQTNPAFAEHTGLEDPDGKTAYGLVPELEHRWVEALAGVAETGEPVQVINEAAGLNRWFDVHVVRVGGERSRRLAVLVTDISEQHRVEEALRSLTSTLEEQVAERTEQARRLSERLATAEQEERRRIALVLHDDLQQRLSGLAMVLSLIGTAPEDGRAGHQQKAEEIVRGAMDLTRTLASEISPPALDSADVTHAFRALAESQKGQHGLGVEVITTGACMVPRRPVRELLYHATRELLFNVVKHAGTDRATLRAQRSGAEIVVSVEDKGKGFRSEAAGEGGLGLFSIRQRVETVGGRLVIRSVPGQGTRVTITVPTG